MTQHPQSSRPAPRGRALTSDELERAACRGTALELWFGPQDEAPATRVKRHRRALHLCAACPIQPQCLAEELRQAWRHTHYGIRGGTTPQQREQLLRAYPDAADWSGDALAALIRPSPACQDVS